MDWYSSKVLSWRVSNTLDASFCVDALEEATERHGAPEIFNADQGNRCTGEDFTDILKRNDIRISMDGKGLWVDNVFVERLGRSVKYEEVYLRTYDSFGNARASLGRYFHFYNTEIRHQSFDRRTPDNVYDESAARLAAWPENALIALSDSRAPLRYIRNIGQQKRACDYSQALYLNGGACRIRTCDQLIKSQLLYQLS